MVQANGLMSMNEQELALIESTFGQNGDMSIATDKVDKMVSFGYPLEFVHKSLRENIPNYVSAGYYLLQMDQNYC